MAGIYNGHILEFPQIRVDCFTAPPPGGWLIPDRVPRSSSHAGPSQPSKIPRAGYRRAPPAQLYLLTHVHSDHLVGLTSDFTGRIVCTPDTKRMLLRLEGESDRKLLLEGIQETPRLRFPGLRAKMRREGRLVVDLIEPLPYGCPRTYDLGYDEDHHPIRVTITALDANHCPGSAMFLIRSSECAVLHTGDVRADSRMLEQLRQHPILQEFIASSVSSPDRPDQAFGQRVLERIYLDTAAMLGTGDMPDKQVVLQDLVRQMELYPSDTIFFLNTWCFGWEEAIKAVARHFGQAVHVDRYKRSIFTAVEQDPSLLAYTTTDALSTRFHACERRAKCSACRTFDIHGRRTWNIEKRIVHVNFVEVKTAEWTVRHTGFLDKLAEAAAQGADGQWPYNIECPIARHSPLPELQALVELFHPRALSPNCVMPQLGGLDHFLLPAFFGHLLQPGGEHLMVAERDAWFTSTLGETRLQDLQMLHNMGAVQAEQSEMSDYHDYLPEPNSMRPQKRGRDEETKRQMAMMGTAIVQATTDYVTSVASRSAPVKSKAHPDEEYDTEDEKMEAVKMVKRRHFDRCQKVSSSTAIPTRRHKASLKLDHESEASVGIVLKSENSDHFVSATGQNGCRRDRVATRPICENLNIKLESQSSLVRAARLKRFQLNVDKVLDDWRDVKADFMC